MSDKPQKKQTFADKLRQLLESLDRALRPTPPAPQPVPIRGSRNTHR